MKKRIVSAGGIFLCFLLLFCFPVLVQGADTHINSIEITVDLAQDGSGRVTEVWDVEAIADMTEWYLVKENLDQQEIFDFSVRDENGNTFENVEHWNIEGSIEEKAGKSGIVTTPDGYELCWGIGSFGSHVFTVEYTMTNLVKRYEDADVLYQEFVKRELSSEPEYFKLVIQKEGVPFTAENTGIWAYGRAGMSNELQDGKIVLESPQGLRSDEYATMLVEFDKGMFSPVVKVNRPFGDLLEEANRGSDYGTDYGNGPGGILGWLASMWKVLLPVVMIFLLPFFNSIKKMGQSSIGMAKMKPEYKTAEYSRELPWRGSLAATYTRLADLKKIPNEGTIIGAYLLRWIRSHQVEIVSHQTNGVFSNKEEPAIKLFDPRPEMEPIERSLYDMFIKASGSDWILQSKEFEKWSKAHFESVQGWLERYKNFGSQTIRAMGGLEEQEVKVFFGLIPTRQSVLTPMGEDLTCKMFGFKKYLEEFTIINEREAREVELWEEYLVFAQVYGIAEKVADQFKALYPDYFRQMATSMGTNYDMFDMYLILRMTNSYGRAMYNGYQAGYQAHINRDSGGGGFSSGGGGFSASGGGGGGGGGR